MNVQGPDYRDRTRCISCGALKVSTNTLFCAPCGAAVSVQMEQGNASIRRAHERRKAQHKPS